MAFKINSVFNSATLSLANDTHQVIYVKRENISENPHNKEIYSTENIELLSYGIEDKGLLEPIIVSVLEKGSSPENTKYQIISGHRRMKAIARIVERQSSKADQFDYIPCIVRSVPVSVEQDGLTEYEDLIDGNLFNRVKTDAERAKELELKRRILEERRKNGELIPGKILELIAVDMNISAHQAKKLNSINRNASESVKTAFEQGALSTDAAYEFSRTDTQTQERTFEKLASEPSRTAKTIRTAIQQEQKEKAQPPKEVKTTQPGNDASNRELLVICSAIKAKLEKSKLTDKEVLELKSRLSAIDDYLDHIKTV